MPRRQRLVRERARKLASEMERDDISKNKKHRDVMKAFNGHVRDIARAYTEVAMEELIKLATKSNSENMRLLASSAIIDRGWGKPAQAVVGGEPDDNPIRHVHEVKRTIIKSTQKK